MAHWRGERDDYGRMRCSALRWPITGKPELAFDLGCAGLAIIKHMHDLSDEVLYQYFAVRSSSNIGSCFGRLVTL